MHDEPQHQSSGLCHLHPVYVSRFRPTYISVTNRVEFSECGRPKANRFFAKSAKLLITNVFNVGSVKTMPSFFSCFALKQQSNAP
jgi:hypothetical protein